LSSESEKQKIFTNYYTYFDIFFIALCKHGYYLLTVFTK